MTKGHPVIAISGIPGAGKTRACERLALRIGAAFIPFDAFETMTIRSPEAALDWLNRGAPWAEMFDPALDDALLDAAAHGPVVFETPLGRLPPAHSALITTAIWLEVDRDIALARKLSAALDPRDWASAAEMSAWVAGFLDGYQRLVRPCLQMQAERVRLLSDHVLDGMASPDVTDERIAGVWGLCDARTMPVPSTGTAMQAGMRR